MWALCSAAVERKTSCWLVASWMWQIRVRLWECSKARCRSSSCKVVWRTSSTTCSPTSWLVSNANLSPSHSATSPLVFRLLRTAAIFPQLSVCFSANHGRVPRGSVASKCAGYAVPCLRLLVQPRSSRPQGAGTRQPSAGHPRFLPRALASEPGRAVFTLKAQKVDPKLSSALAGSLWS